MAERRNIRTKDATNNTFKEFKIKFECGGDFVPLNASVRFYKVKDSRMGFSLTIENAIAIKGCSVVDGKSGLFVSMPSYKGKDGKYYDYVFPVTAEARESLYGQIVKLSETIWDEM